MRDGHSDQNFTWIAVVGISSGVAAKATWRALFGLRWQSEASPRGLDATTAAICGLVENIDENIGRLLEKLETLGIAKRTAVFFLSDNGAEGTANARRRSRRLPRRTSPAATAGIMIVRGEVPAAHARAIFGGLTHRRS